MIVLAGFLYWGLSEDSDIWDQTETWDSQPRVWVIIPALSSHAQFIHSATLHATVLPSWGVLLHCLSLSSLIVFSRAACFFSVKGELFYLNFYVWMNLWWPGSWLKNLWNSCQSLVQLPEAWTNLSLPYLETLGTEKCSGIFFSYNVWFFKCFIFVDK